MTATADDVQTEAGFIIVGIPPAHHTTIEFTSPFPTTRVTRSSLSIDHRAGSARPTPLIPRCFGAPQRIIFPGMGRCPTTAWYSSPSTSAHQAKGGAS
uniref:Uncharacterized protein n=1 Tax=Mycobacterium leprae TaxID=1769 RepID=O32903_MYCLR|nr:hypothetical protein [Mycobacterium leprae]